MWRRLIFAAAVLACVGPLRADPATETRPTTRPVIGSFPAVYTDKIATTPHFYQRDRAGV